VLDTAGRLHVDEDMMLEARQIADQLNPHEILFVANAMTGQDAVNSARQFHEALPLTGVILTQMDGDARGGAAISLIEVTGCPVKFVGVGEKLDALEPFHPERMANRFWAWATSCRWSKRRSRLLTSDKAEEFQKKMRKGDWDLEDF
jgi:signal recognition particle subunit SRP54